jgi:uncharacterized membrane protein
MSFSSTRNRLKLIIVDFKIIWLALITALISRFIECLSNPDQELSWSAIVGMLFYLLASSTDAFLFGRWFEPSDKSRSKWSIALGISFSVCIGVLAAWIFNLHINPQAS